MPLSRGSRGAASPVVHPQAVQHPLGERVERLLPEMVVFIALPGGSAHVNMAERRVRPVVMTRTISSGSRNPNGSVTRRGAGQSLWYEGLAQGSHPFSPHVALLTPANCFA